MHAVWDWWLSLWPDHGLIGPLIAVVVAAFALLIAGNVVIWTLVGIKRLGQGIAAGFREQRSEHGLSPAELREFQAQSKTEDPHQELGVVDEGPVDHR